MLKSHLYHSYFLATYWLNTRVTIAPQSSLRSRKVLFTGFQTIEMVDPASNLYDFQQLSVNMVFSFSRGMNLDIFRRPSSPIPPGSICNFHSYAANKDSLPKCSLFCTRKTAHDYTTKTMFVRMICSRVAVLSYHSCLFLRKLGVRLPPKTGPL